VGSCIGPYEVRSVLGRGGTSVVYRGFCRQTQKPVALKVLRQEFRLDSSYRGRLEREGKVLKQLEHPHLLRFYECGEHGALLFVAMEFVAGLSLRQLLQMRGALPPEEAVPIMLQVLQGLQRAHESAILHRDLKPENVLLTEQGQVKLSDFGCAKGPGLASVTAEGVVLGTPTYMAPEHFQNKHTPMSDQYSAGVMFYEMVCGRVPFLETEPVALAMAHVGKKPPAPQSLMPDLPDGLCNALLKSLSKKPEQRFENLGQLAEALEAAI